MEILAVARCKRAYYTVCEYEEEAVKASAWFVKQFK